MLLLAWGCMLLHTVRLRLRGAEPDVANGVWDAAATLAGTPVPFEVLSAAAVPTQSTLVPPRNADALQADLEAPTPIMLLTRDKYAPPPN